MLSQLIELTEEAGKIAMKHHNNLQSVTYKSDDKFDPLTIADTEVDAFLRAWVKDLYDALILSEEHEEKELDYTGDVRMIDPIDWTKDFVWWSGKFSVMIWLCRAWRPNLWVVYKPYSKTWYYAEKWQWSFKMVKWETPVRLSVASTDLLSNARCVGKSQFSEPRESEDKIKEALWIETLKVWGTVWGILWEIAEWSSDIYFFTNPRWWKWDICWPQIILEEAWWKVTDTQWNKIDYVSAWHKISNWFIATNWVLHDQVLQVYKDIS